jgi:hypothetical protein
MKRAVRELTGAALDWAVAVALNKQFNEDRVVKIMRREATTPPWIERENAPGSAPHYHRYSPSTDHLQGGEIIDREGISTIRVCIDYQHEDNWAAEVGRQTAEQTTEHQQHEPMYQFYTASVTYGSTRLMAAMRAYVVPWLGRTIELPEDLR